MYLPSLFVLLVYISGILFLLFSAICLACGLMYCVELAEEQTVLTSKLIRLVIYCELILHPLLFIYERFPILPPLLAFLSHLTYLTLLQTFPFIEPSSPQALLALTLFLTSNFFYYRFFTADHYDFFYRYQLAPLPAMPAFFLIGIWLVPLAFFVSLTVNDSVLPGAGVDEPMLSQGKKKKSRNVVAAIGSVVKNWFGNERDSHAGMRY